MLYFCSSDDIMEVLSASGRFSDAVDKARKSVTEDMTRIMNRNLEAASVVEYFDVTHTVHTYDIKKLWLLKKNVDLSSVIVSYSWCRQWDDNVIPQDLITGNGDDGWITVPGYMRKARQGLRVAYTGGYGPIYDTTDPENPVATDVMDCPNTLRDACVQECVYRLTSLLNLDVGQDQDTKGNSRSLARSKKIMGCLQETAMTCFMFRKPNGE